MIAKPAGLKIPYPPNVGLVLRGIDLDPKNTTEMLGVIPDSSFKKGDKRKDGKEWPHGFWTFSSSGKVQSSDLIMHLTWLIEQFEPVKMNLIEILKSRNIDGEISCFWIMPNSNETVVFDPELLKRIAELEIRFELSIHSPDNDK